MPRYTSFCFLKNKNKNKNKGGGTPFYYLLFPFALMSVTFLSLFLLFFRKKGGVGEYTCAHIYFDVRKKIIL